MNAVNDPTNVVFIIRFTTAAKGGVLKLVIDLVEVVLVELGSVQGLAELKPDLAPCVHSILVKAVHVVACGQVGSVSRNGSKIINKGFPHSQTKIISKQQTTSLLVLISSGLIGI